jgi:hypothetical protein
MKRGSTLIAESANGQTTIVRQVRVALPLLKALKDQKSSGNEPLAVRKGYDISLDRQDTWRRAVAPFIASFKVITSQAEGTAMVARGVALARHRFRARDYRLAHH